MMMNMFLIFDPSSSPHFSLNWMSLFMFMLIYPWPFWLQSSRYSLLWQTTITYLLKEFKILISYSFSNLIILISLFTMIMTNNFMGLFPYVYTASSHMSFCLSLGLPLWIGMMTYSIFNYMNDLYTHLTPQGTPMILMPFMVIIESISLIIRPLTLSVRLMANMIAGHLLMTLISSSGTKMYSIMIPMLLMLEIMLLTLETAVSLIQAYVFSTLTTLYSSEI